MQYKPTIPPSGGSSWGAEWEQGRWSALCFSVSRWWMWKIPVRGPDAVSLKPGDLYAGKGIQKAGGEKTYYILSAPKCTYCLLVLYRIQYKSSYFLLNKTVTIEPYWRQSCSFYANNTTWASSFCLSSRCVPPCVCITLKYTGGMSPRPAASISKGLYSLAPPTVFFPINSAISLV